ncbi:MAG: GLUG motif-containing protein, partial [Candidatus Hadarchaeales archaeon]
ATGNVISWKEEDYGHDFGGLVGANYGEDAIIRYCYSAGNVVLGDEGEKTEYVGGLVGYNSEGTIQNCYATGDVEGYEDVGGLVGFNDGGTIQYCYATGYVEGYEYVGGLVGRNDEGTIQNCYATGYVEGHEDVGGLVGFDYSGSVSNCYSNGYVDGSTSVGGLLGYNNSAIYSNSFWDTETSGQPTSAAGTGKTTAQMKQQSTYTGWDFVDIWRIETGRNYGYPFLLALGAPLTNSPPVASNPKAEGQTNPTNLTTYTPTFTWDFSDADDNSQTQRQIQVGTTLNGNDMWDSTLSTSSQSAVYAGSTLSRGVTYYWRVRVYDGQDWSSWASGTFKLIPEPSITTTETATHLENVMAGDSVPITVGDFQLTIVFGQSVGSLDITHEVTAIDMDLGSGLAAYSEGITIELSSSVSLTATLTMTIPKSWATANNVDPTSIRIMRYKNGTWTELSTTVQETANSYVLTAQVTGFSTFVAVGSVRQEAPSAGEAPPEVTLPGQQPAPPSAPAEDVGFLVFIACVGILIIAIIALIKFAILPKKE